MRLEEILRLEDVLHSMKDALVNLDKEWRFIYANQNALQFLNKTEAELIGSSIWDVMQGLKDTAFEQELSRSMHRREEVSFETYFAKNNTWFEMRAKPCGEGICMFFTDITAHKTVGLALKQSEELFSKAFYSCPAALVISRIHDGLIVDTNESYELLIKYNKNELIDRDIRELHDSEDRKIMVRQVLKEGRVRNFKMNITNKLGKVINCVLSADLIRMGDVDCVITTLVDVTELNETQKALHYMNANLETMVRARTAELADALQREKEMNELKSQFVTMASHEFRTPLTTILSSASLIEKYTGAEQQEQRNKHVERIKFAVKNLTDILNEFLSLEKLEHGKVEAKGEAFDLEEFTAKIVEDLSGILKEGQKIIYTHKGEKAVMLDSK
ncbi:MAG: PAS domain-containing sensor histidine kinase, partial [Bacteroidia bacterium]